MTTLAHAQPTLEDRILSSTLIVVGTVEEGPLSAPDYSTHPGQVHSHFKVAIEDTLRGRAPASSLTLRMLGGQAEDLRTTWTSPLREGDRVLLLLAPYFAADREEDLFV